MSKHEIKQLLGNNQCLINNYEQQDEKITKDTNLVIGAGIFGLNIALNLIEKGEKVLLVTESFESISYHYPIGAHTSKLKTDNLSLYSFNSKIINPLWILNLMLNYNYTKYNKHKEYCAEYGYNLFNTKYNINIYKKENNDFILDSKYIINFILNILTQSNNFRYVIKSINTKNKENLNVLSNNFKNVYICIGSKCRSHMFLQKIGGYKFYVNSNKKPESIDIDNGYFLNNNTMFNNPKFSFNLDSECNNKKIINTDEDNKDIIQNTLIVRGGVLVGDKAYHDVIYQKQNEYDLDKTYRDNLEANFISKVCNKFKKKIYKLNQNKFWKKYDCFDIEKIMKGVRGVSADNLPFYYKNKNIYHIEGGSFIGMITAPVLADALINNNKTKINFNISRLYINTFIKILFLLAILWIIQFKLYIFY
jgi:hypothetical protein